MNHFATRSVDPVNCSYWRTLRFAIVIFFWITNLIGLAIPVQAQDVLHLKRLILDAQEANLGKFENGTMSAIVTLTHKGRASVQMETQVQWDGATRFWEYRISDPEAIYGTPNRSKLPLEKEPLEYTLRTHDKVITGNSRYNKIVVMSMPQRAKYARSELFEITPDPLWKVCCSPFIMDGRPWKDLLEKPLVETAPNDEIRFEKRENGIIRMTSYSPNDGFSASYDFSLPLGGNLVRFTSETKGKAKSRWSITNEWAKEGDAVRLVRSKSLQGDDEDSKADMVLDIQVRSMRPGASKTPLSLETIVAKMPKNVQISDMIRNRTYSADPKARPMVTDVQIRALSDEVKKGEFLR